MQTEPQQTMDYSACVCVCHTQVTPWWTHYTRTHTQHQTALIRTMAYVQCAV